MGQTTPDRPLDEFHTHQLSGFFDPPHSQDGHAWTIAWTYDLGAHWQFVGEWLRAVSNFPPRLALDQLAAQTQTQLQLAARYHFKAGW